MDPTIESVPDDQAPETASETFSLLDIVADTFTDVFLLVEATDGWRIAN
jgi:hypothetical protein